MLLRSILLFSAIVALALAIVACDSILHIDDVSLGCYVASDYGNISEKTSTSTTFTYMSDDVSSVMYPTLNIKLDKVRAPFGAPIQAMLTLQLRRDLGELRASGGADLSTPDNGIDCAICVYIVVSICGPTPSYQAYWGYGEGTLKLDSTSDAMTLRGSLLKQRLRQINYVDRLSQTSVSDVPDGCTISIDQANFDKRLDANLQITPPC